MRILVANDDGIYSPGLAALARAAAQFGEVRVVAPDVEMSAAGHSVTASRPLMVKRTPVLEEEGIEAYRVNGTPADCVAIGMFQWGDVDIVLSGINLGANLGNGTWHSGTLAAAKQSVLFGSRGIAFSTPVKSENPDFASLEPWVCRALDLLLPRDDLSLVNVNLPPRPRGMTWTRLALKHYDGKVVPGEDPMGRKHFWFTIEPLEATEEGTDLYAIRHGYVSMTPLRLDLTHHDDLDRLRQAQPLDAVEPRAPTEPVEEIDEEG